VPKVTLPLGFGITGFLVGMALCGYAFYLTSHNQNAEMGLFLILCPPSILSMALDNAGTLVGILAWLFISFCNAGFYALMGAVLRAIDRSL
jgi:hypothetical protein